MSPHCSRKEPHDHRCCCFRATTNTSKQAPRSQQAGSHPEPNPTLAACHSRYSDKKHTARWPESFPFQRTFSVVFSLRSRSRERTIVMLFHAYFHRGGTCTRFLLCVVLLLSIDSTLHAFFQRRHVSVYEFSLGTPVSILSFLTSKFRSLRF